LGRFTFGKLGIKRELDSSQGEGKIEGGDKLIITVNIFAQRIPNRMAKN